MERLYHLDRLRVWCVYGVVALHGAMTYMEGCPGWWYVQDQSRWWGFTLLVLMLDVFLMPVMFFLAGYLAPGSLDRRGGGGFVRERLRRLGPPWILGVVLFAPLFALASLVNLGYPVPPLGTFVWKVFLGPAYQQAHFWFLGVLISFSLIFPLLWRWLCPLVDRVPMGGWVAACWVLAAGWFVVMGRHFPLDGWVHPGYVLVFQPLRIGGYLLVFLLGAAAGRGGWFGGDRSALADLGLAILGICLLGASVAMRLQLPPKPQGVHLLVYAALNQGSAVLMPLGLVAVMRRLGSGGSCRLDLASRASYGLYWLHQMILVPIAWALGGLGLPALVKFSLVVGLTVWLGEISSARVLPRVPWLGGSFQ